MSRVRAGAIKCMFSDEGGAGVDVRIVFRWSGIYADHVCAMCGAVSCSLSVTCTRHLCTFSPVPASFADEWTSTTVRLIVVFFTLALFIFLFLMWKRLYQQNGAFRMKEVFRPLAASIDRSAAAAAAAAYGNCTAFLAARAP